MMVLGLVGCAPTPRLVAAWYLVDEPTTDAGAGSSVTPDSAKLAAPTHVYMVALINRGRADLPVYDVSVNVPPGDAPMRMLAPGDILLVRKPIGDRCFVPTRVYVRTRPGRSRPATIRIAHPAPSLLPAELQKDECLMKERVAPQSTPESPR